MLVREEIRRVGAWYRFHITKMQDEVAKIRHAGPTDRITRGFLALLQEKKLLLEARYAHLPAMFKGVGEGVNAGGIKLGLELDV